MRVTTKGQVTIPRDLRQHFGLKQGVSVTFEIEGDHIALRPAASARKDSASGFGLIQSPCPGMPVYLDVASLRANAP